MKNRSKLSQQLTRVFTALCEDTDTPVSREALSLLKSGDLEKLFQLRAYPVAYSDPVSFFKDNVVVEFLRKLDVDIGLDLEEKAIETFLSLERQNKTTNDRLSRFRHNGPFEDLSDLRIMSFIDIVRKVIAGWLGNVPKDITPRHGKGATFRDRAPLNTVPDKMTSRPTITQDAVCLLDLFEGTAWQRALVRRRYSSPEVVPGNRFTTVEKDAMKRRGICVEPSINLAYQLALGKRIRSRLFQKTGIDLDDGQELHCDLAQRASRTGDRATIDLSNASDNVSLELVKLLLPPMWCEVLLTLRSPLTCVRGEWHRLEKFSSMGNGYTFELETLLFAGIAEGLSIAMGLSPRAGSGIWVYGDDIIVDAELSQALLSCLKFFGFVPNERKTFTDGPFRESCGGDFFLGEPVRAHYVKKDPIEPSDWISLANGLRRLQNGPCDHFDWSRLYGRAWRRAIDPIPNHIRRLRGPSSLGDIVIHDRTWRSRHTRVNGIVDPNQQEVECYLPIHKPIPWVHWYWDVHLASALYGVDSNGPIPREGDELKVSGYRIGWVSVLERPASE